MAKKRKKSFEKTEGLDAGKVLAVFRKKRKPLTVQEILFGLGAHKKQKQHLLHILQLLQAQGKVIQTRNAFALTSRMKMVTGRLEIQRSGVGFLIPEDRRRKDIFINPRDFGGAWHGDKVVGAVTRDGRGGRHAEGRIVRVIERGMKIMPARVEKRLGQNYFLCQPTDTRQIASFMIEMEGGKSPEIGDIVMIEPAEPIDRELWSGEVTQILGQEFDVAVQELLVKANHNIPMAFPKGVLAEAANLPDEPTEDDFADRRDLRHLPFVTIDGAKARDFDDAIYVEREGDGYRLWVAIADVSHYVPVGSRLDEEARERANSYYFPTSVEPMFPEALSNGLCSLNPNVNRLAMVAEMRMDANGGYVEGDFYPAVIRSHARLTYAQVNRALFEKDGDERVNVGPVLPLLELAEELARKINRLKKQRGSLDFDLPEPEILFNIYGETTDIRPRVRHFGHQIIEEFMIAANEAVAEFLTERQIPFLYRIHPEPDADKLKNLFRVLSRTDLGVEMPDEVTPRDFQALLRAAEGTDQEFMVGRLALRSMMQAKYSPANEGHFGLASECYCHFTSPIRRYADLVVHRALKRALGMDVPATGFKRLLGLGDHLSKQERIAMDAEREILKRLTVLLLKDRVGQEFTGVINGLADFGFWVELTEVMAEGLVRLSTLSDDYYGYLADHQMLLGQRTGRSFKLGQKVRVTLEEVNLARLEVNLVLAE